MNTTRPSISPERVSPDRVQPHQTSSSARLDRGLLLSVVLVFSAACVMFFYKLGAFPLFNPDETLYAEPAREMLEIGEYTTTYLDYVVRYTKPPLVIWAMAACYRAFGVNEFAARFLGAACAGILVVAAYLFARKYAGRRPAWIAASVLITSPLFIGVARESITDMPLSLFIAGSLMSMYHGFMQQTARWRWLGYILIGLAFMTKGPVGLVLPIGIMLAFHCLRGDLSTAWKYYKPLPGLVLAAAVALPWFVVEIAKTNGEYYRQFILYENVQRFTGVVDHKQPWFYHIICMLGGLFPWAITMPFACVQTIRSIHLRMQPLSAVPSQIRDWARGNSFLVFNALSWSVILLFFSLSQSKLVPYTVPGFAAAAIFIGIYIDGLFKQSRVKQIAFLFAGLCAAYAIGAFVSPSLVAKLRDCPPDLKSILPIALWCQCAIAAVSLAVLKLKKDATSIAVFAILTCVALIGFGTEILGIASNEWEAPVRDFAQFASNCEFPIIVYGARKPSVMYYAHKQILYELNAVELRQALADLPHAYVICKTKGTEFLNGPGCRRVAASPQFVLTRWDRPGDPTAE